MHIWTIENWVKVLDYDNIPYRSGLRLKFDKEVDPDLREECKRFAAWLREEYFFPVRVPIYFKNKRKLRCMDGDWAYWTFLRPGDYRDEPYARIAVGDFPELCLKWGRTDALFSVFFFMAHVLTHYFQWVNDLKLTPIGEKRQATCYARYILDDYREVWSPDQEKELSDNMAATLPSL